MLFAVFSIGMHYLGALEDMDKGGVICIFITQVMYLHDRIWGDGRKEKNEENPFKT